VLTNLEQIIKQDILADRVTGIFPTLKDWADSIWPIIRGSFIGFFVSILPGAGTVIPTFMAYTVEKRLSKHPEKFGTGTIEGVAAPETANNAAAAGSMVTLLSLGLPSSVGMAILLGAFIIHGIQPGPLLIVKHPALFWGTIASMYVGNVMLLVLNLPLIGLWIKILKIPYNLLFPLIILFCFLGAYSLNNNIYDVLVMIIFGVFGYLMRKYEYEGAPFLLALVLGPMLENAFRQSLIYGDPFIFFNRPISAVLICVSLFLLISPLFKTFSQKRKTIEKVLDEGD